MIQSYTLCDVADNTGAKKVRVIQVLGHTPRHTATVGDIIIGTVKAASPNGQVKKKEVVRAVVVRTRFPSLRADGSTIRFDDNAVVIVGTDSLPKGTRILGPVARELREKGYAKIISLAQEVL